ncbi:MAG: hypothetical protein COB76_05795, partial [Alphaproteobacteria bacterium]
MRLFLTIFCFFLCVSSASWAQLLIPHEARYDVSLMSRKQGASIQSIEGALDFSLNANCHAWLTNYTSDMTYHYSEGVVKSIESKFSAFEDWKGESLDYAMRRYENDHLVESLRFCSGFVMCVAFSSGFSFYDTLPKIN